MTGIILILIAAILDGMRTGWIHDGRKSFERKFNVDPYGFWGSESWRMIYKDGDPDKGAKSWLHYNIGAMDFEHFSDRTYKICYIVGGFLTGTWIYLGIAIALSILAKRTAMRWIRGKKIFL